MPHCEICSAQTQQLFEEDVNKSLNSTKDVCSLKKKMFPETSRSTKAASNNSSIREHTVGINFCRRAQTTKGTPQQAPESLNEIFQHLENQLPHYIRLVPAIPI